MRKAEKENRFTYVVFDMDDTLFDYSKSERRALRAAIEEFGAICTEKILVDYSYFNRKLWRRLEAGEIDREQLLHERFQWLAAQTGLDSSLEEDFNLAYLNRLAACHYLKPNAKGIVKRLSRKYSLAIATNGTDFVQHQRLRDSGLGGYFENLFISGEIGYSKPDIRFFKFMLEKISVDDPKRVLLVGDSPSADIVGAQTVGFTTCLVTSKMELNDTGVKPDFTIDRLSKLKKII